MSFHGVQLGSACVEHRKLEDLYDSVLNDDVVGSMVDWVLRFPHF